MPTVEDRIKDTIQGLERDLKILAACFPQKQNPQKSEELIAPLDELIQRLQAMKEV